MAPHGLADIRDLPVLQDWHDQRTVPRPQACGVEACGARLIKKYHLKHRLCPQHCKCLAVLRRGVPQRWCAQCNVFHTLDAFFATQGSCMAKLKAHNERRTRPPGAPAATLRPTKRRGDAQPAAAPAAGAAPATAYPRPSTQLWRSEGDAGPAPAQLVGAHGAEPLWLPAGHGRVIYDAAPAPVRLPAKRARDVGDAAAAPAAPAHPADGYGAAPVWLPAERGRGVGSAAAAPAARAYPAAQHGAGRVWLPAERGRDACDAAAGPAADVEMPAGGVRGTRARRPSPADALPGVPGHAAGVAAPPSAAGVDAYWPKVEPRGGPAAARKAGGAQPADSGGSPGGRSSSSDADEANWVSAVVARARAAEAAADGLGEVGAVAASLLRLARAGKPRASELLRVEC